MTADGLSRVLVIDDDDDILQFIAAILSGDGYQPIIRGNMEDALNEFDDMNYVLVITDIFMDGMGGIDGITELKKRHPDVKVIAMSAGFRDMPVEKVLKAASKIGADAIMAKPLYPEKVSETVRDMLS